MTAIIFELYGRADNPPLPYESGQRFSLRLEDRLALDLPTLGVAMRQGDPVKVTVAINADEPTAHLVKHVLAVQNVSDPCPKSAIENLGVSNPADVVRAVGVPAWWEFRRRRVAKLVATEVLRRISDGATPGGVFSDFAMLKAAPVRLSRLEDACAHLDHWASTRRLLSSGPGPVVGLKRTLEIIGRVYHSAENPPLHYLGRNAAALSIMHSLSAPQFDGNRTVAAARAFLMQADDLGFLRRQWPDDACSEMAGSLLAYSDSPATVQTIKMEAIKILTALSELRAAA